jgi:tetratricopeptide (TPR) repeat protein
MGAIESALSRFTHNAYRITGQPGSASLIEIRREADNIRRAARVGRETTKDIDMPWLGPVTREEADVREALGRLILPSQRLEERLFWFHEAVSIPINLPIILTEQKHNDNSVVQHDMAVLLLLHVLRIGPNLEEEDLWLKVLDHWAALVERKEYWETTLKTEIRGGFEPAATAEEVESLRGRALTLVADIIAGIARDAIAHNKSSLCYRALSLLRKAQLPGSISAVLENEVLGAEEDNFEAFCGALQKGLNDKIERTAGNEADNRRISEEELQHFNEEIEPALKRIIAFSGADCGTGLRARDAAANCLNSIALAYTWADEFELARKLQSKACALVPQDSVVRSQIAESAEKVARAARSQQIWKDLKPVDAAPSMSTINGFGFRLYGQSDTDPDTGSYLSTYYFVALFIPIFPIGRYRVRSTGGDSYQFYGKAPLRKFDKWHLGIVSALIASLVIYGIITADSSGSYSYSPSNSYSPSSNNSPSSGLSPQNYGYSIPKPDTASGFNPPSGTSQTQISELKTKIEVERMILRKYEVDLASINTEFTQLQSEIKAYKRQISGFETNVNLGIPVNEVAYQQSIDSHNSRAQRLNALAQKGEQMEKDYEAALKSVNQNINRYNLLIKR